MKKFEHRIKGEQAKDDWYNPNSSSLIVFLINKEKILSLKANAVKLQVGVHSVLNRLFIDIFDILIRLSGLDIESPEFIF